MPSRTVILDTNTIEPDYEMTGAKMTALLSRVQRGEIRLVIPSVVVAELDKHYARCVRDTRRDFRQSVKRLSEELSKLKIEPPAEPPWPDPTTYRERFERRLAEFGAVIESPPNDLDLVVEWAIRRRRPFNDQGHGVPDACIWLVALAEADANVSLPVCLVTTDGHFSTSKKGTRLGDDLEADLVQRGLTDRVRLYRSVDQLFDALTLVREETQEWATALMSDATTRKTLEGAAVSDLLYEQVDLIELDASFADLDVLYIESVEVLGSDLTHVVPVSDTDIQLTVNFTVAVSLGGYVPRSAGVLLEEDPDVTVGPFDVEEEQAQVAVDAELLVPIAFLLERSRPNVVGVSRLGRLSLTKAARARRLLLDVARNDLLGAVSHVIATTSPGVEDYVPDTPLLSEPSEVALFELNEMTITAVTVESLGKPDDFLAEVTIEGDGSIQWSASVVDPLEMDTTQDDVQTLSDVEAFAPCVVKCSVEVSLPDYLGGDLELVSVALAKEEATRRERESQERRDQIERPEWF